MAIEILTQQQESDLRNLLVRRRTFLKSALERGLHADDDVSVRGTAPSDADTPTADVDAELALSRLARDQNELNAVEQALERVDSGDYAECVSCGNPIGYARLLAHPSATTCLVCQEKRETSSGRH
jgi:DnaK suppressor protein